MVIIMYQYSFLDYNKYTTLVREVDNEGIVHFWRGREYMGTMYLPLKFSVNLKLL